MPDAGDTVLVTGASGFVGAAIAIAARRAGYRVRVLVRATSPRSNIQPEDEVIIGDIRDRASLAQALRGARYLIHAAADYRLWSRTPSEIITTNTEGTRCVMDETRPLSERDAIGAYKKSKVMAERLVEDMVRRERLPAVIVNPSTPIGPRDVKPTPTGRIIVEAASGRMPAFVDTGLNLVHVDDVAAGHLAALARGTIGERYILGGENVYLRDMLAEVARVVGRKPPRVRLPLAPLYPLAIVAEGVGLITGREPFLTLDGLRMARHHMFFNDAKARRELGYSSRPYREAIADAIAWFRQHSYLR